MTNVQDFPNVKPQSSCCQPVSVELLVNILSKSRMLNGLSTYTVDFKILKKKNKAAKSEQHMFCKSRQISCQIIPDFLSQPSEPQTHRVQHSICPRYLPSRGRDHAHHDLLVHFMFLRVEESFEKLCDDGHGRLMGLPALIPGAKRSYNRFRAIEVRGGTGTTIQQNISEWRTTRTATWQHIK